MFWYIVWFLASVSTFGKSMEKNKWEWLAIPSLLSGVLSLFIIFFTFLDMI